ncbi:hypothetical protein [Vreelandella titanicae]|uniref:hypothetical protein n=1 Tax=Vreelandella titanicae TaxID=664683 RepID=UPI0037F37F82
MTIDHTFDRDKAIQQIAEHLVKETTVKVVADIGPMLASGTRGSVIGDTELFGPGSLLKAYDDMRLRPLFTLGHNFDFEHRAAMPGDTNDHRHHD